MTYDRDFADMTSWLQARKLQLHIPLRGAPYLTCALTGRFVRVL